MTQQFLIPGAPANFCQLLHRAATNKQRTLRSMLNMPNGTIVPSSHTCDLLITDLPPQAQKAHILPGLVHNSFISVGQLCDNGCSLTFTQEQVTVSKNGKYVMYRARDPRSRLWRDDLKQIFETNQVQCNHAHDNINQKDLINYLHVACFSPVKSTWISAIKNGNFTSWPGLTEQDVEKHLSKFTSTTKGHLNQQKAECKDHKIQGPKGDCHRT
jgi:hypothetical protein